MTIERPTRCARVALSLAAVLDVVNAELIRFLGTDPGSVRRGSAPTPE